MRLEDLETTSYSKTVESQSGPKLLCTSRKAKSIQLKIKRGRHGRSSEERDGVFHLQKGAQGRVLYGSKIGKVVIWGILGIRVGYYARKVRRKDQYATLVRISCNCISLTIRKGILDFC